jgi:signal transduction histidine kinase
VIASAPATPPGVARFRTKLLIAMMLVLVVLTGLALYLVQRNAALTAEQELQREFQTELAALHAVQDARNAALLERCRALVRRPRIHAALEDNALDLLYPSAQDELRDLRADPIALDHGSFALHAEFYRFLDRNGAVIPAPNPDQVGRLRPEEEAQLALPTVPAAQQLGYIVRRGDDRHETLFEILAMPIVSSETGEVIAALVLGVRPATFAGARTGAGIRRGLWVGQRLYFEPLLHPSDASVLPEVTRAIEAGSPGARVIEEIEGVPHLLFYKQLNSGSMFRPAYEVCVYPLTELKTRQSKLRLQVIGAAGVLLLLGLGASHFLAGKLARPVEKLAEDSVENLVQRARAEAALETTSEELQRAARFSADASHQLKTPVTVMRAGLEELLTRDNLTPDECNEISALIHQTYRLSSVIEDLLLLSRMDAGRLKIDFGAVNLTEMIEAALDDLSAQPEGLDLSIETDFPSGLFVRGEKRYLSLILQNLLENARKYNHAGGKIRIVAQPREDTVSLMIANTGQPISAMAREHIFERFHRGTMAENITGYGLGLNLARELARLHHGDLRLLRSDDEWTEFEVTFQLAALKGSGAPA